MYKRFSFSKFVFILKKFQMLLSKSEGRGSSGF